MTTTSPKPLTLTIEDFHQARADYPATLHMRFPVDEETTRKLNAVIRQPTQQPPKKWPQVTSRWLRW